MRISTLGFSNTMLLSLSRNQSKLFNVQNKIANQTRLLRPSDDPVASTQLAQLQRDRATTGQYLTNIDRLNGNLMLQESSVKGTEQQLLAITDKLQEAMGGTHSAEEIAGYGKELETMLESTVAMLNTRDQEGNFLFSGTKKDRQPVVLDPQTGRWSYQGNSDSASATVANGVSVDVTTHLAQTLGEDLETLNQLKALAEKMQDPSLDPADYAQEMSSTLETVKTSHNQMASLYTELGGRFNTLSLLKDAHTDNDVANSTLINSLTALDMGQASIELAGYYTSSMAAQKSYTKIQQLSLFSLI